MDEYVTSAIIMSFDSIVVSLNLEMISPAVGYG